MGIKDILTKTSGNQPDDTQSDSINALPSAPNSLEGSVSLFPAYCLKEAVTLAVKGDSSMNKRDWTIKNAIDDVVLATAKGKPHSIKVERVFSDTQGQEICVLRRHKTIRQGDYYLENMHGETILDFKKEGSALRANFTDPTNGQFRQIRIDADFYKSKGSLFLDRQYIGHIGKEPGTSMWAGSPTYNVPVPAGLDYMVMTVIAVVFICLVREYEENLAGAIA